MIKENEKIFRMLVALKDSKKRLSCWKKGVFEYAILLLDEAEKVLTYENCKQVLLNGAKDWKEYSYGGCALVYDEDIAKALCTPSELKKTKYGVYRPNKLESWLDVQARALYQAYKDIKNVIDFLDGFKNYKR